MRLNSKEFSIEYIEIIEDVVDFGTKNKYSQPVSKVQELSERLEAHFDIWQIGALESIQNRNDNVAFHFGNSDQLTTTLEYSPLYVDHVVLQDLVFRILNSRDTAGNKLMKIRPLVEESRKYRILIEEGLVSIVPSPIFWDENIRSHLLSLPPTDHQFAVPLYASLLLGCDPMTDVPALSRQLPQIAKSTVGRDVADTSASVVGDIGNDDRAIDEIYYQNTITEMESGDIIDILPLLLGNKRATQTPELWCLENPDPMELIELSSDVAGFRKEVNDTVDRVSVNEDISEIHELLEEASERVEDEYEYLQSTRESYRKNLGKDSIKIVLQSVPLMFGLTQQDLLTSLLTTGPSTGLVGMRLQKLLERRREGPPGEENAVFRTFNHFSTSF